eukprot:CAMPEP_0174348580 /NCGR_PEP_ID=MMETSP0811_2-20130205/5099_1 /TAXON_ID=73025 ORGANISM="Eutreptiella gymnastica-like, Strain CCMP1594" /NCGR_SAMPLE_ID=MMETSP0811_2 /ASSEMBLY_ACC=CAM_ASM_000667 /LENGTH=133 /DNA_ID=CAMNT_0015475259 /DNA_START=219 /DNA_END=621 /DNA_ORIENTATION=+
MFLSETLRAVIACGTRITEDRGHGFAALPKGVLEDSRSFGMANTASTPWEPATCCHMMEGSHERSADITPPKTLKPAAARPTLSLDTSPWLAPPCVGASAALRRHAGPQARGWRYVLNGEGGLHHLTKMETGK